MECARISPLAALSAAMLAACSPATVTQSPSGSTGGTQGAGQSITVAIRPSSVELSAGSSVDFNASVFGTTEEGVTWRAVEPSGGVVDAGGHYTAPRTAGTYHVVAASEADPTASATATVVVQPASPGGASDPAPAISSFSATPSAITAGESATLSWSVSGATSITIDQGVGAVSGDSESVSPTTTTTYTLAASNSAGSVTAATTVTVTPSGSGSGGGGGGSGGVTQHGTGGTYAPSYVTVTGGGAMPSTSGAPNADACRGLSDARTCLNEAIASARSAGKPLVINSGSYTVSGQLDVATSLIGVDTGGGQPTITSTNGDDGLEASVIHLVENFTGWVYNLHLVGAGGDREYTTGITIGGVDGVTIKGNLVESPGGDDLNDLWQQRDSEPARNVLIDGNTLRGAHRCAISFNNQLDRWAIVNNVIDYQDSYVGPVDFEPWDPGVGHITNVEVSYNELLSPSAGDQYYWSVIAVDSGGFVNPGGNIYLTHNYGTWGVPFFYQSNPNWTNVVVTDNSEGDAPPG